MPYFMPNAMPHVFSAADCCSHCVKATKGEQVAGGVDMVALARSSAIPYAIPYVLLHVLTAADCHGHRAKATEGQQVAGGVHVVALARGFGPYVSPAMFWLQIAAAIVRRPQKGSRLRAAWTRSHWLAGWGSLAAGLANCGTGVHLLRPISSWWIALAAAVLSSIVACVCLSPCTCSLPPTVACSPHTARRLQGVHPLHPILFRFPAHICTPEP